MSCARAFFALAPPRTLPEGQLAYQVLETFGGRISSILVTPYWPEALADVLIKARRPLNWPLHDGGPEDETITRVTPLPGEVMPSLRLEIFSRDAFEPRSVTTLTGVISDGNTVTGLIRGVSAYQGPHYSIARESLANRLASESEFHPDVMLSMTCCASAQPSHPFWQAPKDGLP